MCQLLTRLDRLCILVSTMRFRGDPRRTSAPWSREALASTILAVLWTCSPGLARTRPRIVGTQANRTAEQVLRSLVSTPLGRAAPPNPWQVILIDDRRVNAYANGAGWLTVTSGLAAILGNDGAAPAAGAVAPACVPAPPAVAALPRFPVAAAALLALMPSASISRRASISRNCLWNCSGESEVCLRKC